MIFVLASVVWAHRPRWHRTPRLAEARRVDRPPVRFFPAPGADPVLGALADAGGDLHAHRTVHLEDR